jgi:hypothetical protein
VAALLLAFLMLQYGRVLQLPLVNDDYFFLDKTRASSFVSLWGTNALIFGWYRPWSREQHYWVLDSLFGSRELAFHLANFALWLAALVLYFTLARRLAGPRIAALAVAGVAALSLWGAPLIWAAGAQDLWMLVFALLALHACLSGRVGGTGVALMLALASKETAAVLPAIATACLLLVRREPIATALRRTAPLWGLVVLWAVLHPTLRERLLSAPQHSLETAQRPSAAMTLAKTLLAQVSLDALPRPGTEWGYVLGQGVVGLLLLASIWALGARAEGDRSAADAPLPRTDGHTSARSVVGFGCVWAVAGWAPLLLPSIGWHAYYGVVGTLGAWLAIATAIARWPVTAFALVAALAFLRPARAVTPSWDWGSEWYQFRAGAILRPMRTVLMQAYPSFPPHSRLFFARVPNNIGFLAGDGPALRVWYRDTTLRGYFYSRFARRAKASPAGRDYFFRFDSVRVWVEVHQGPEDLWAAQAADPEWEHDHRVLAGMLASAGEVQGAAAEYAKLFQAFPHRAEYALFAAVCHDALGDRESAARFYRHAARGMRATEVAVRLAAQQLMSVLPRGE